MSFKIPRLSLFKGEFPAWLSIFQPYWQQAAEAIEAHETVQDGILETLQTTDAAITLAQEELEAAQLALTNLVTELTATQADLAAAIADVIAAQAAADAAAATATTAASGVTTITTAGNYSASGIDLVSGASFFINGTQVLGPRQTGWTAATGTASRVTFATYTAPTISAGYVQAEVQAIANALQVVSQHQKALIDDLITQGLIGP